jgi:hypothetical protein
MQNNKESGGLHRDEPNQDSCRPDDVTISKNAGVQRNEECARRAGPHAEPVAGVAVNGRDMRRSTRRRFETMIRVYGNNLKGNAFYEVARTIDVSVHGALLVLNVPVAIGQKLLLFNEAIRRQQVCQVVDVRVRNTEALVVAVAFPTPHAEFWQAVPARPRTSVAATPHAPSALAVQPAELASKR